MMKFNRVRVECYNNGYFGFIEIFTDIDQKQIEKELNQFVCSGFDCFKIHKTIADKNGEKIQRQTLILRKKLL